MASSIRIAKVFPELAGKEKNHATLKVYGGMLKYTEHQKQRPNFIVYL